METTKESVILFSEANGFTRGDRNTFLKRNAVCDLVGVAHITGRAWFVEHSLPNGKNLLRIRLLLDVCGYELLERSSLSKSTRMMGDIVALSLASLDECAHALSVKSQTVLDLALGKSKPLPEREKLITDFVALHETRRLETTAAWKTKLNELGIVFFVAGSERPLNREQAALPRRIDEKSDKVEMLAHLVLAMQPLAAEINSGTFSEADREHLRTLTQSGRSFGLFKLSTDLAGLCGERARAQLQHALRTTQPPS